MQVCKLKKLLLIQFTAKLILNILAHFADNYFEDYNSSNHLIVKNPEEFWFQKLKFQSSWDSQFFQEIATNEYRFEKNHAFFPLFPKIIEKSAQLLSNFALLGQNVEIQTYQLLAILIIQLILNVLTIIPLYKMSVYFFSKKKNSTQQKALDKAYLVSLLFIFNPSQIFYVAVYTESLFSFLSITCLYTFYLKKSMIFKNDLTQIFLFLSTLTRANGLFLLAVIGFPILQNFLQNTFQKRDLKAAFYNLLEGVFTLVFQLLSYTLVLTIPYFLYCKQGDEEYQVPEWCEYRVPNVYGYIQDRYWSVGFLQSYKLHRAFFIYWGIQTLYLFGRGIFQYKKLIWLQLKCALNKKKDQKCLEQFKNEAQKYQFYNVDEMHGMFLYSFVMFWISALVAHIQSCTRFMSSNPFFYYIMADNFVKKPKYTLFYFVHFNIAGVFLFVNFLPWT